MIEKTYESPRSVVANMTIMVGGKPRRISFYPVSEHMGRRTGLGSMYKTCNERIQKAIEKHVMFGSRIFLVGTREIEEKPVVNEDAPNLAQHTEGGEEENGKYIKVPKNEVSSPNDARAYMIEHFKDVAQKSMPNIKAIINSGLRHGVVFEVFEEEMKK